MSNSQIIRPSDVIEEMRIDLLNGLEKGTTTYIDLVDEGWTWRPTEVNIDTGYANEGKSTWKRFLCLIKALEEKKKFCFFAPEDAPAKTFFDDIIHTLSGKSTDKSNPNFIGLDLYNKCYEVIKDLFVFIYIKPPENTIDNIIKKWTEVLDANPDTYGFIIDPFVRVSRGKSSPERDDLFAAYFMSVLTDFARESKTSVHVIMHQQTPKRTELGYYPKPNMYSVKSGGTFADMVDNVTSIWRPFYAKDKINTEVTITTEKIKKQKLVGIPTEMKFKFDRISNRYVDISSRIYPEKDVHIVPLYNFNKWIEGGNLKKIRI